MKTWYVNISEQYKYFTWTPQRTGSTHFTKLLDKFQFQTKHFDEDGNVTTIDNHSTHNHYCRFFNNHLEYKFLITVRNPYSMVISRLALPLSKLTFDDFMKDASWKIENMFQSMLSPEDCCECFTIRKPDSFIRLEHLYEDWLNLPFVKNHPINTSGELKKICSVRENQQPHTEDSNYWKRFYNQRLADLVYYNFPNSFELFGYDKDSWKS